MRTLLLDKQNVPASLFKREILPRRQIPDKFGGARCLRALGIWRIPKSARYTFVNASRVRNSDSTRARIEGEALLSRATITSSSALFLRPLCWEV